MRARQRLERALDVAGLGLVEVELATGERYWTRTTFRILGFDPDGPMPTVAAVFARIHPDAQAQVQETLRCGYGGEHWEPCEYPVLLADGGFRRIRTVAEIEEDPATVRHVLTSPVQDVTQLKAFEIELHATIDRERELGRLKSEFPNLVSHECRTPLGVIVSSAQILER